MIPEGGFPFVGGVLHVADRPLPEWVERGGGTPLYLYDGGRVENRVARLRKEFPASLALHYAVKANPFPPLLKRLAPLVDGMDIASGLELEAALSAGVSAADISFAGPGKRPAEMRRALEAGVLFNVESEGEVDRLRAMSESVGVPARVAVRVNPDFDVKSSGLRMGGGAKPFGIDSERVPSLLPELDRRGLAFEGFHFFVGSQILRADALVEAHNKIVELALRLAASAPKETRVLNIGGGFGIPYFPGDNPLDTGPVAENLFRLTEALSTAAPRARMVLELGRYLVGEAGLYVCRVIDKKVSRGRTFLVVDGGLHHHLAASGHFGQVIRKNFPVSLGRAEGGPCETVSIVGPLCTPMDVLGDRVDLPEAVIGDLVVIHQSGAYGATASPGRFLGHPPPGEILV